MPQADTAQLTASAVMATASLTGWGGGRAASARVVRPRRLDELPGALTTWRALGGAERGAIARGMGRSYGDAAQLDGGLVLDTTQLDGYELDARHGVVCAQAGVTLARLLEDLVPQGWMVPVLPGTQHVTVGGAVASDIHGKNHGTAGTFGSHVEAIGLLSATGELHELRAEDADPRFTATVGGMGLTGLIVWARIRLRRVSSPLLSVDTDRVQGLDDALAALSTPGGSYRVAWLDLLGRPPARGIVTRAEHLPDQDVPRHHDARATVAARATVPAGWPGGLLRPVTVRAFNELRFRAAPRRRRGAVESIGRHMFPLDGLDAWPRLYGPRGFVQYQLVVPPDADRVLARVIEELGRSGEPCYLAVLKDFGAANSFPLSFPIAGWTLALDLPRAASGLDAALDRLDQLVAEAGGRVYLSKDARLGPDTLAEMYPRLDEWRAARDQADPEGLWRSDLGERTGLVGPPRPSATARRPRSEPTARSPAAPPLSEPTAPPPAAPPLSEPTAPPQASRPPLRHRVLLLGGSSDIGLAIVRRLAAERPVEPYLIGRHRGRIERALAELEDCGASGGHVDLLDANDLPAQREVIARAFARTGGFDTVVLAVGVLGAQAGLDADRTEALEVMQTNFLGAGSLLLECLERLRDQGAGTLVVLSTVAVERPRASNAIYGAAKAGLDALAQGLADAVAGSGVRVLVVRPGFVTTKMTRGLEPAPMATTAEAVAEATARALHGRDHTVWVPGRLRPVFALLRHLPRPLFRRLPL
jgi:decaprenylphospho-beta-D-ribofuranose 2-oxidase